MQAALFVSKGRSRFMEYQETKDALGRRMLLLSDGKTEVGVALDFGIRVIHLSCVEQENLFYQQPLDCSDGFFKPTGWRLYGGHRMWLAPQNQQVYHGDNTPIHHTLLESGVVVTQDLDPLSGLEKELTILFADDGHIRLNHRVYNRTDHIITGASWSINTFDQGGKAIVHFKGTDRSDLTPRRIVSLWGNTNLGDPRLLFTEDSLTVTHTPLDAFFKLGLYSKTGTAIFENKNQRLTLSFGVPPLESLCDGGCNFELYMCSKFIELEPLGEIVSIAPGQYATHWEEWFLERL